MPKDRTTADVQVLLDRGHESIQLKDFQEAVECFSRVIALRPDVAAGYRARARAYLELGQRTDALNDLDRAIRLKPDDPVLYAERAEILHRQKAFTPRRLQTVTPSCHSIAVGRPFMASVGNATPQRATA